MESKAWLGTDEISTLAIAALEVVVFFVCGAESGWCSERLKAVKQSMQQYSQRQLLIPTSEIKEHQEHIRCIEYMLCQFRVEVRAWRGGSIARRLDNHVDMMVSRGGD
mmetsp:Transcript_28328/g.67506  ORF Transcript_28328/g.67506 Transcript_28328/m.67506 type:complete len:108 (+) Transcript_28328:676-999(+)